MPVRSWPIFGRDGKVFRAAGFEGRPYPAGGIARDVPRGGGRGWFDGGGGNGWFGGGMGARRGETYVGESTPFTEGGAAREPGKVLNPERGLSCIPKLSKVEATSVIEALARDFHDCPRCRLPRLEGGMGGRELPFCGSPGTGGGRPRGGCGLGGSGRGLGGRGRVRMPFSSSSPLTIVTSASC